MARTTRFMGGVLIVCISWWGLTAGIDALLSPTPGFGRTLLHPSLTDLPVRLLGLVLIILGAGWWRRGCRQREQLSAALRLSETRYRDLIENCPDSIIVYRDDRILYLNRMATTWLQVAPGTDLDTLSVNSFIHPEDRKPSAARRTAIASGHQSMLPPIVRLALPDGKALSAVITTCRIEYGGQPALLSFCRDVTEQIETRENLAMSQERLSLALEAARDGAWDWNMVTNRLNYNEAWADMLGRPPFSGEYSPETWQELVHPDDLPLVQAKVAAHARGETDNYEAEVRLRHVDGHYIWVLDRGRVIERAPDGTPLRMVGTHREITARKRAEVELAVRNAVAEVFLTSPREEVFNNILPAIGRAVFSPTVFLGLLESHDKLQLAGQIRGEGKPSTLVWPDFDQAMPPDCRRVLGEKVPVVAADAVEFAPIPGSFSPAVLVPVHSQDLTMGFLMVADRETPYQPDDIAMLASLSDYLAPILKYHLESASKESQLRQAQKMEAVGALAGGIAHDFNNILQAIMGFATLAAEEVQGSDSRTDSFIANDLERVLRATRRGQELVERILLFSRQQEQEIRALDLDRVIVETVELLQNTIPATIEMRTELADDCPPVLADTTQIRQILLNLATNSFHAMEKGKGTLTFGLASVPAHDPDRSVPDSLANRDLVLLTVTDTGSGIDEATLERIFDPFFTTKDVDKGTGLGLSVVHGIVADLGGEITIDSTVGRGTSVQIFLPTVSPAAPSDSEAAYSTSPIGAVASAVNPGQILFLDDEADIAALGEALLVKQGHHVTSFTSSQAALEALRANPSGFDLLITDLTMPHLTGIDLAAEAARIRPDLPVVLITGQNEEPDPAQTKQTHICGLLHKPFGGDTLREAVARALASTEPRPEAGGAR